MGVWIDTDMGFDDIAAILVLQHQGVAIDGVSLCFGNAPLPQVCANATGAAQAFGWHFPLFPGRDRPVLASLETAGNVLGATGIPTAGHALPAVAALPQGDGFLALCEWLARSGAPKRILALGPLTNIAALVLAQPALAAAIGELLWMGGGVTRGNHTASAEFNAYADPEALGIVLAHGLPLKMVDLDFCRRILASPEDVAPIRRAGGCNAELLADLTAGYIDIAISRGRSAMALYDPTAAVALARPDLVSFAPAHLAVEMVGRVTRGRTVVETRASHATFNAAYAVDGDVAAIRRIILEALQAEAAKP